MEGSETLQDNAANTDTDNMSDEDFLLNEMKNGFPSINGKDARKDDEPVEEEKGEAKEPEKPEEEKEPEVEEAEPVELPVSVPRDLKAALSKLPREEQLKFVEWQERRDRDMSDKSRKFAEAQKLEETITPYLSKWKLNGIAPSVAVERSLAMHDFLENDFDNAMHYIASTYGRDLSQVAQVQTNFNDPTFLEMQSIKKELEELRSWKEERETYEEQSKQESVNQYYGTSVRAFMESKDPAGNAVYPYFYEVKKAMTPIVAMLEEENPSADPMAILKTAYEQAVWANPQTRKRLLQEEETKRQAQARAKSEQAKKAGFALGRSGSIVIEGADEQDDESYLTNWLAQRRK